MGTEDAGIWRYDPQAAGHARWTQFTTRDGLGDDNAYALTCDHQGRIWCGHLNHGVSVFNGQTWRNYDVLSGPIGERVFSLATCPTDGDVWIGTSAGLTRYSVAADSWRSFTRADGLPADQISAVAFDKTGRVYVGTDCDGLAVGAPADHYQTWRTVTGPDREPIQVRGHGLPSKLINAVLVAQDGTVYVATRSGLARSNDGGQSWEYGRGRDWTDKVKGLETGPPPNWQEQAGAQLTEDYVTCLAQDARGLLWVGHWRRGFEVYNPQTGEQVYQDVAQFERRAYVRAILPTTGGGTLMATYGGGLVRVGMEFGKVETMQIGTPAEDNQAAIPAMLLAALPAPAKPPSIADLQAMLRRVEAANESLAAGTGAFLGDDWRTRGDWVGRYGRRWAVLCGVGVPDHKHIVDFSYNVETQLGPHHKQGDMRRFSNFWPQTDDPRALYDPLPGERRGGEFSDHSEAYNPAHEGPDLWVTAQVPEGIHRISLYFFNWNGHEDKTRFRDCTVELKTYTENLAAAAAAPAQARARVHDFSEPVYKQFIVRGPAKFYIRIARNGSYNTILQGVMLDKLVGPKTRFDDVPLLPFLGGLHYEPPDPEAPVPPDPHALEKILAAPPGLAVLQPQPPAEKDRSQIVSAARQLWSSLNQAQGSATAIPLQWPYRLMAYRAAVAHGAPADVLTNWRWNLRLWSQAERKEWKEVIDKFHQSWMDKHPELKGHRIS